MTKQQRVVELVDTGAAAPGRRTAGGATGKKHHHAALSLLAGSSPAPLIFAALLAVGCVQPTEPDVCYLVTDYDASGVVVGQFESDRVEEALPEGVAFRVHWPCTD